VERAGGGQPAAALGSKLDLVGHGGLPRPRLQARRQDAPRHLPPDHRCLCWRLGPRQQWERLSKGWGGSRGRWARRRRAARLERVQAACHQPGRLRAAFASPLAPPGVRRRGSFRPSAPPSLPPSVRPSLPCCWLLHAIACSWLARACPCRDSCSCSMLDARCSMRAPQPRPAGSTLNRLMATFADGARATDLRHRAAGVGRLGGLGLRRRRRPGAQVAAGGNSQPRHVALGCRNRRHGRARRRRRRRPFFSLSLGRCGFPRSPLWSAPRCARLSPCGRSSSRGLGRRGAAPLRARLAFPRS